MQYFDVNEIPVERDNSNAHPQYCWCDNCKDRKWSEYVEREYVNVAAVSVETR